MKECFFNTKPRERALEIQLTKEALERSIINVGDNGRLARVIKKALNGEDIFIGTIGGSITDGTAATEHNCYSERFVRWWQDTFPNCNVGFKNAGIGATDSLLAVHRAEQDLLKYEPDLVVVEFSVNDTDPDCVDLFGKTYECLIRRIMLMEKAPAVMLLYMCGRGGWNMREIHSKVGMHYNLPIVSYGDAIISPDGKWLYDWEMLSPDTIHPNDLGHEIASEILIHYVNCVYSHIDTVKAEATPVPSVLNGDDFVNGMLHTNKTLEAFDLGDFHIDDHAFWQFHHGWTAEGGEKPLVFKVYAKNIFFYYKRDVKSNAGKFDVILDGETVYTIDAEFKNGWGDNVKIYRILLSDTVMEHTVEFKPIIEGEKNRVTILGLLLS